MKPLFDTATLAKSTVTLPTIIGGDALVKHSQELVPLSTERTAVQPPRISIDAVGEIGAAAAGALKGVSSSLLGQVKASNTGDFGKGLGDLVGLAKGLNPEALQSRGLLGRLRGLVSSAKERLMTQYASVDTQITTLTTDLDKKAQLHRVRIADLESLYLSNFNYHEELDSSVAHCRHLLAQALADYEQEKAKVVGNSFGAQVLNDHQRLIGRIEKRTDDLERAKVLSKQLAPQIRQMQDDTRALIQKFGDVLAVTLPAWRNIFTLYVLQLEQKQAVQLLDSIDDTTNEALRKSADLLRENSVAIAESRNRSVVSIDTLTHVQAQLLGSITDVQRIDGEARKRRQEEAPKLIEMEQELIRTFAPGQR